MKVHPTTTVFENHANNDDDLRALQSMVQAHGNTVEHLDPEHVTVDKGSRIRENVHHHVHHLVQPVLEKDTMDKHRIHTSIPINEASHVKGSSVKGFAGKFESMMPGEYEASTPAGHCKGCNCGEMHRVSDSFGKSASISESPDTSSHRMNGSYERNGAHGINDDINRQSESISVM
ncbi:hypothetical protein C0991_011941 [Blastosporella zonata]|nr:hypothetical protein C0991_011941 [Blastosporella zonata]